MVVLGACTAALMAAATLLYVAWGEPLSAALMGARVLAVSGLLLLCRRGVPLSWATHGLLLIMYTGNAMILIGSGATVPIALIGPVLFPVLATALTGLRGGVLWGGLTVSSLVIGLSAERLGLPTPLEVGPERFETFRRFGIWFVILFGVVLSLVIEYLKRSSLDELDAARRRAEEASADRAQFLARMSHEIRTPLNGVLGMARLMQQTDLCPQQAELMGGMLRSGDNLLALLNDLLDITKLEAGRLELELRPVDVHQLAADTAALMRPAATEGGLTLRFCAALPGCWRQTDSKRVQQIILNLLSNAIKFTPPGGTVTLRLSTAGGRLQLAVTDTGPGIPAAQQPRLFEPFAQADASVARRHGGTGLGLAICRDLAERLGGTVRLDSTVGEGSCFTLDIPAPAAVPPAPAAHADLTGMRVLVAEDHAVNQLIIRELLTAAGCIVTLVEDGQQAVDLAHQEGFDVILMDWHMPVLDGPDAALQLQLRHPDPPPVIALTANATPEARQRCAEVGIVDFLTKPLSPDDLHAALAPHTPQYRAASSSVSG